MPKPRLTKAQARVMVRLNRQQVYGYVGSRQFWDYPFAPYDTKTRGMVSPRVMDSLRDRGYVRTVSDDGNVAIYGLTDLGHEVFQTAVLPLRVKERYA